MIITRECVLGHLKCALFSQKLKLHKSVIIIFIVFSLICAYAAYGISQKLHACGPNLTVLLFILYNPYVRFQDFKISHFTKFDVHMQ